MKTRDIKLDVGNVQGIIYVGVRSRRWGYVVDDFLKLTPKAALRLATLLVKAAKPKPKKKVTR